MEQWETVEKNRWSEEKFNHFVKLLDLRQEVVSVKGLDRKYPTVKPNFDVRIPETWRTDSGLIKLPVVS